MKAKLAARRLTCANPEGCRRPLRTSWYPGYCRVCAGDAGFLALLGVPPYEILDTGGICPRCGQAWDEDVCHVCGSPGRPRGYLSALTGREMPEEPPFVLACVFAYNSISIGDGDISGPELARFLMRHGITDPEERDEWEHRIRTYGGAYLSARNMGTIAAQEAARKKAAKD